MNFQNFPFMDFLNSDTIKLITCLLAIYAIVNIFLKHKPQGSSIRKVHIWYICGIGTFIVIQLITWICVCNPESTLIMQTVSFAATLASLILSVLAIFITVISNDSLVRVKDSLNEVPKKVSESVEQSLTKLTDLSNTLESTAVKNKEEQEATVKQISELLDRLGNNIEQHFKEHDKKFEDLSRSFSQTMNEPKSMQDTSETTMLKDESIEYFSSNASTLALLLIYMADQYMQKEVIKPLSTIELLKVLGFQDGKDYSLYMYCVIMMLSSFGLLEYRQPTDGDVEHLIITSVNETLTKNGFKILETRLSDKKLIKRIEEYINTLVSKEDDEQPKES